MSRSYKHTPVYKGDKDRFAKKLANRRIRQRTKRNRTIIGKKMNRGIYAIIVIGESLSGEKNLVLILEIIRICGKNIIGENKKMHYVVSDIHNDYQKFCELLKVIKLSKEDKLFILGDLFDRSD